MSIEVYENSISKIKHFVFVDNQLVESDDLVFFDITNAEGDVVVADEAYLVIEDGRPHYEYMIGPDVTANIGVYDINWQYSAGGFQSVSKRQALIVSRPYCEYMDYKQTYEDDPISPGDFQKIEKVVRGVIDSFCRQSFQYDLGMSYTIVGSGHNTLELPRRLVELHEVRVMDSSTDFYNIDEYVTTDPDEKYRIRRLDWNPFGAGMNPVSNNRLFKSHRNYRVTGDWGWENVPEPVREAAKILINAYQCADAKYREKFIQTIRAADWRMEFAVTGNETTGNANADTLLSDYKHFMWEVI